MFWKGYFFVMVAINLAAPFVIPPAFYDVNALFFFGAFVSLLSLVGLFGFAFKERIFSQWAWKLYWALGIVYLILSFFFPASPQVMEAVMPQIARIVILFLVIFIAHIPAFIALFLYAFKSKDIWQQPTVAPEVAKKMTKR